MYKRDLITTEIEKLAQVLARIIGLKKELRFAEAEKLFDETLLTAFGLDKAILTDPNEEVFIHWLEHTNIVHERLNVLSDFLYSELDFENQMVSSQLIAKKLDLIYNLLMNKHQIIHMVNLGRQKYIQQFI